MSKKSDFHVYLIRVVIALFLTPPLLFVLLDRLGLNKNASFFLCLGLFMYILIYMCLFTTRTYRVRTARMKRL